MRIDRKLILALFVVGTITIGVAVSFAFLFDQKLQGFRIYLSQNNQVVITDEDAVWYNKSSHEMRLSEEGKNRL